MTSCSNMCTSCGCNTGRVKKHVPCPHAEANVIQSILSYGSPGALWTHTRTQSVPHTLLQISKQQEAHVCFKDAEVTSLRWHQAGKCNSMTVMRGTGVYWEMADRGVIKSSEEGELLRQQLHSLQFSLLRLEMELVSIMRSAELQDIKFMVT